MKKLEGVIHLSFDVPALANLPLDERMVLTDTLYNIVQTAIMKSFGSLNKAAEAKNMYDDILQDKSGAISFTSDDQESAAKWKSCRETASVLCVEALKPFFPEETDLSVKFAANIFTTQTKTANDALKAVLPPHVRLAVGNPSTSSLPVPAPKFRFDQPFHQPKTQFNANGKFALQDGEVKPIHRDAWTPKF